MLSILKHPVYARLFMAQVDLSRFDAAPLIAFTATKEMNYGTKTDGRIPQGRSAYRTDQRAYRCPAVAACSDERGASKWRMILASGC